MICREISDREVMSGALVGLAALDLEHDRECARRLRELAARLRARLGTPPLAHVRPTQALVDRALRARTLTSTDEGLLDERASDAALAALIGELRGEDRLPRRATRASERRTRPGAE